MQTKIPYPWNIFNCVCSIKVQGIIGVCRIIDHTIWQTELSDFDSNATYESIDDLPAGNAQVAAKYFGNWKDSLI